MQWCSFANARERLAVLRGRFAAVRPRDAGPGHEVALIAAVDEDRGRKSVAGFGFEREQPGTAFADAVQFFDARPFEDPDSGLREHFAEDGFGDVGLVI